MPPRPQNVECGDSLESSAMTSSSSSSSSGVAAGIPAHLSVCRDTANEAAKAASLLQTLRDRISQEESTAATSGLSFLELKNHLMLDYLSDLALVMLTKSQGKSIEGSASVDRLVSLRTVLEKMRPIERKLKYQIDKAIKMSEAESIEESDPLSFRPNPANLVSKLGDEDEDDSADEEDVGNSNEKKGKGLSYALSSGHQLVNYAPTSLSSQPESTSCRRTCPCSTRTTRVTRRWPRRRRPRRRSRC